MSRKSNANPVESEKGVEQRKKDHIELTFESATAIREINDRFFYEPIMGAHPDASISPFTFINKSFDHPIWISSMTGGTAYAKVINHNLARACNEFGLGMGLGSCRGLLYSDEFFEDFDVRNIIGDQPLYANIGIAQIEYLIEHKETYKLQELLNRLQADGLIIHVNPLQEFLQIEGDPIRVPPIETIKRLLNIVDYKIIIKEVGQGMGMESLKSLLSLPIEAIEFAAFGGTNFSKLEQLRFKSNKGIDPIVFVGHSALDMVNMVNEITSDSSNSVCCKQVIISGGIKNYLDGFYLINKSNLPAIYGQASSFLKYAKGSYEELQKHVASEISSFKFAQAYLKLRK